MNERAIYDCQHKQWPYTDAHTNIQSTAESKNFPNSRNNSKVAAHKILEAVGRHIRLEKNLQILY